jgi:hypothetical protein
MRIMSVQYVNKLIQVNAACGSNADVKSIDATMFCTAESSYWWISKPRKLEACARCAIHIRTIGKFRRNVVQGIICVLLVEEAVA